MDGPLVQQYKFLWKDFHLMLKYLNYKSSFNLLVLSNVIEKLKSPEFGFITIKVVVAIFINFLKITRYKPSIKSDRKPMNLCR